MNKELVEAMENEEVKEDDSLQYLSKCQRKKIEKRKKKALKQQMKLERKQAKLEEKGVSKEGVHTKRVWFVYILLILCIVVCVWNNFTVTNEKEYYEFETVEEVNYDTSAIEQFAIDFVKAYYTYGSGDEKTRTDKLQKYLSTNLDSYAGNSSDVKSEVSNVKLWGVSNSDDENFEVTLEVTQKFTAKENTEEKILDGQGQQTNTFVVGVHSDYKGLTITKLPVISTHVSYGDYEEEETFVNVDDKTKEKINTFLDDFFKVYLGLSESDLKYYVEDGVMPVVETSTFQYSGNFEFNVVSEDEERIEVEVQVAFTQSTSEFDTMFEYCLVIEETEDTYKIVEMVSK